MAIEAAAPHGRGAPWHAIAHQVPARLAMLARAAGAVGAAALPGALGLLGVLLLGLAGYLVTPALGALVLGVFCLLGQHAITIRRAPARDDGDRRGG